MEFKNFNNIKEINEFINEILYAIMELDNTQIEHIFNWMIFEDDFEIDDIREKAKELWENWYTDELIITD